MNYKVSFKSYQNQGIGIHYKQLKSQTIIKLTKPTPCNFPESQSGLYLDISIRQSSSSNKLQNWSSFQHYLKQLFDQIIDLQKYPNSMLRVYIFILQNQIDIRSTIINGLWLLVLKMGVSMKKSIYCVQKSEQSSIKLTNMIELQNQQQNEQISTNNINKHIKRVIYDLNDQQCVIEGEIHTKRLRQKSEEEQREQIKKQIKQYKQFVRRIMKENLLLC